MEELRCFAENSTLERRATWTVLSSMPSQWIELAEGPFSAYVIFFCPEKLGHPSNSSVSRGKGIAVQTEVYCSANWTWTEAFLSKETVPLDRASKKQYHWTGRHYIHVFNFLNLFQLHSHARYMYGLKSDFGDVIRGLV